MNLRAFEFAARLDWRGLKLGLKPAAARTLTFIHNSSGRDVSHLFGFIAEPRSWVRKRRSGLASPVPLRQMERTIRAAVTQSI
jgi:hypothetical protein